MSDKSSTFSNISHVPRRLDCHRHTFLRYQVATTNSLIIGCIQRILSPTYHHSNLAGSTGFRAQETRRPWRKRIHRFTGTIHSTHRCNCTTRTQNCVIRYTPSQSQDPSQPRDNNSDRTSVDPQQLPLGYSNGYYGSPMHLGPVDVPPNSNPEWSSQQVVCDTNGNRVFAGRRFGPQGPQTIPERNLVGSDGWSMNSSDMLCSGMLPGPTADSKPPLLTSKLSQIERTVATWLRKSKTPLADSAIEEKARYFAGMSGGETDRLLINSPGWLEKFKQKNGIATSPSVSSVVYQGRVWKP